MDLDLDQSSYHTAMAEDALDVSRMNVRTSKIARNCVGRKASKDVFQYWCAKGQEDNSRRKGGTLRKEDMQSILRNHGLS